MIRTFVMGAGLVVVASPALAQEAPAYRLQPGDRVEISVLEDPGLNRQVLIGPDGRISLPLAGSVRAGGQTVDALQSAIRGRLADDFIEPPTVTVSLTGVAEGAAEEAVDPALLSTIYIIGQVQGPGRYDLEPPVDILQALAVAGGASTFAARDRIQIRRRVDGADVMILFDYDQVEDGVVPIQPIELQDGDVVVVPERGLFE